MRSSKIKLQFQEGHNCSKKNRSYNQVPTKKQSKKGWLKKHTDESIQSLYNTVMGADCHSTNFS